MKLSEKDYNTIMSILHMFLDREDLDEFSAEDIQEAIEAIDAIGTY